MGKIIDYLMANLSQITNREITIIIFGTLLLAVGIFYVFRWLYINRLKAQQELINIKDESLDACKERMEDLKTENLEFRQMRTRFQSNHRIYKEISKKIIDISSKQNKLNKLTELKYQLIFCELEIVRSSIVVLSSARQIIDCYNYLQLQSFYMEDISPIVAKQRIENIEDVLLTKFGILVKKGFDDLSETTKEIEVSNEDIKKYSSELSSICDVFDKYLDDFFKRFDDKDVEVVKWTQSIKNGGEVNS